MNKIEEVVNNYLKRPELKRYTKRELIKWVKRAENDIKNGNVVSQKHAEKLSKKW